MFSMMSSMNLAAVTALLCLCMTSLTEGCSVTADWRRQPIGQRLNEADLVVYARAVSIQNVSATANEREYKILTTAVQCVMKNTANLTITGTLSVGQDAEPPCTDHLVNVQVGSTYLMMLRPPSSGTFGGTYLFDSINIQESAVTVEINTLMNRCDFADAALPSSPPAGATCPAVDDSGPCVGAAGRLGNSPAIVALMVIWAMILRHFTGGDF